MVISPMMLFLPSSSKYVKAIEGQCKSICYQIDVALLLSDHPAIFHNIVQWPFCMLLHYSPMLNFSIQLPNTNHACTHYSQWHFNVYMCLGNCAKGFTQLQYFIHYCSKLYNVRKYKNMNYNMRGSDQAANVVEGTKVLKIMSSIVWLYFMVLTITDFCV